MTGVRVWFLHGLDAGLYSAFGSFAYIANNKNICTLIVHSWSFIDCITGAYVSRWFIIVLGLFRCWLLTYKFIDTFPGILNRSLLPEHAAINPPL